MKLLNRRSNGDAGASAGAERGPAAAPAGAAPPPSKGEGRRALRLLTHFAKGQRKWFWLAFLMLVAEALTAVYAVKPLAYLFGYLTRSANADNPPLLFQPLLDLLGAAPGQRTPLIGTVAILTAGIVVLAMLNSFADSLAEIFLARGGRLLGMSLRTTLHNHLQRLSLAFHNRSRTGDVLARVTSDVAQVEDFLTGSASDVTGSLLIVPIIVVTIFMTSWQLGVAAIVIVPVVMVISRSFSGRIKASAKRERAREGDLASAAQEMLTSIRVIQTYGRGGAEQERFYEQSRRTMEAALRTARLEAGFSWTVKTTEALAISGILWVGVLLIRQPGPETTVDDLILFLGLVDQMFKPTRRIIKEWSLIGKILASVERIAELLDRKPAVDDLPGAVPAPPLRGRVEFRRISFAYQIEPQDGSGPSSGGQPVRLALNDVSFRADPGEVVALVGPSGAGKSTVAQLVPRLYDPHAGAVLIDGHDIREFTLASLRAQISMVLQETILFSGTVAYNIAYGRPEATRDEIIAAAMKANAHDFIAKMPDGYETELGERGGNLSGGQRQRIAIARALVRSAPILMLDEPTTGLDAESTDLVLQALQRLMAGKTTIMISHDLNLVRPADRILVIRDGRIEQSGSHDRLLAEGGLYASLYARQFGAAEPPTPPPPPPDEEQLDSGEEVFETLLLEALPLPASRVAVESIVRPR
ncbi:MAG: ABC transporter ATP-binding protein [Actinomycetota bacterium]